MLGRAGGEADMDVVLEEREEPRRLRRHTGSLVSVAKWRVWGHLLLSQRRSAATGGGGFWRSGGYSKPRPQLLGMSAPPLSRCVAALWRKVWQVTCGAMPALLADERSWC